MNKDFRTAYAEYLVSETDLARAGTTTETNDEVIARLLDAQKAAAWKLIQTPAVKFEDIRQRARIVSDMFIDVANAGRYTDNRHILMLAALVTEISGYSGEQEAAS
jgi:hypothetical protein